jgi:hypothetical protein
MTPAYVWEAVEKDMRVEETMRKSVIFIGVETEAGFYPTGTCLVVLAYVEGKMAMPMAVTARHLFDAIPGDYVSIRMNRKVGGADTIKMEKKYHATFQDKSIDLVLFNCHIDPTIYDVAPFHLDKDAWQKQIDELGGGPPQAGDEVCTIGLYATHYGLQRNEPIVRIGHVAAIPNEPVFSNFGLAKGFLIEVHSIMGLSGSPVYWTIPPVRVAGKKIQYLRIPQYILLGIFIGYHLTNIRNDQIVVPDVQSEPKWQFGKEPPKGWGEEQRTGFGVVLPIAYIFAIIESEMMQSVLKKSFAEWRERTGFRPASATIPHHLEIVSASKDENPYHLEDFTSLLNAAAKKQPQGD